MPDTPPSATFSPADYGLGVSEFLIGRRGAAELTRLAHPERTLFPASPHPREAVAGLWLLWGDLDRSHTISQDLSTPEAAFWHGIMHRREPDPGNAAYWFRRVGRHAAFPRLHEAATTAGYGAGGAGGWDPFAWIEYWDRAQRRPGSRELELAARVERLEWEILFDHCARPRPEAHPA